jgi:hypothetical protein
MKIGVSIWPCIAVVVAAPLGAQYTDGLRLTTPLGLSAGHDQGFLVEDRELTDTVYLLTAPTVSLLKTTRRTGFRADYQPEFEWFARNRGLRAWTHSGGLRLTHQVSPRLGFEVGDLFLSTRDPTRWRGESLFLLPRSRFQQNSAYAGLNYRLDRQTTLGARVDNALLLVDMPGTAAAAFDQIGTAGTVSLERVINPQHTLAGNYSYLYVWPLGTGLLSGVDRRRPAHAANGIYTYRPDPGLIFSLGGGVVRSNQWAYTAVARVEKRLLELRRGSLWAAAGYERYLAFFGGLLAAGGPTAGAARFSEGVLPNSLYEVGSFRLYGNLTRRLGVELRGMRARNEVPLRPNDIKTVIGHARLSYNLTDRLIVFGNADYYGQNVNDFVNRELSRRRYFGGLEIVLQRPPEEAVLAQQRRDAQEAETGEPERPVVRRGIPRLRER